MIALSSLKGDLEKEILRHLFISLLLWNGRAQQDDKACQSTRMGKVVQIIVVVWNLLYVDASLVLCDTKLEQLRHLKLNFNCF